MPPTASCGRWRDRRANGRTRAQLSLDIGRAMSAGQELRPLLAKLGYGPKTFALDQLKIGQPGSVMLEGAGNFDRANATGKLALDFSAASLGQIADLIAPFAPALAARLNAMGSGPGPARAQAGARSRQECRSGRSRQCARRCRYRRAAAQGRRPPSPQSRPSRRSTASISRRWAQRNRDRVETVVGAGPRAADAAGARSRRRGRRGAGAIRRLGGRRVGRAVAAEGKNLGRGTGCRSGGHG